MDCQNQSYTRWCEVIVANITIVVANQTDVRREIKLTEPHMMRGNM